MIASSVRLTIFGIESLASEDAPHNLFRTLGPTLLISMAYLDLGKWLVAVDAGSRFGYDLVLMVLLFNSSAILFQYLSTCIAMGTGKNLAEICSQQYSQAICVGLGFQAGLSLLISELTMIAGLAVGFNIVFEYDDLITSICFASVIVNLLPYTLSRMGKRMAGMFNACIAGFTLLCFVLGLLVSHPKTPVNMDVMFPKLSGESAYSLMALLGSNIIVHNFYTHSSVVQVQRRSRILTLGSLFHDHLFSILFIFTGIFLVNYVLLISAADESSNTMAFNFQDVDLMHQIFTNPAAPVLLLVILLFSSHIISLTCTISSDVISDNLFGVKLPLFAHHLLPKGVAMISTIYCAKVGGAEGIYESLIVCPVIQAMLLPSSVIPIFRVTSSRLLMGRYRISLYVEILAFLAFLLMLFTNIIFVAEILFGESIWTNNLKGNTGNPVVLPYTAVVLMSFASIAFTLFLAVTPLKSVSKESETQSSSVLPQRETMGTNHHREATSQDNVVYEVQRSLVNAIPRGSLEGRQIPAFEHTCSSDTITVSNPDAQHPTARRIINPESHPSPYLNLEEPKSIWDDWMDPVSKACTATIVKHGTTEDIKVKTATEKIVQVEADVWTDKYNKVSRDLEFEKPDGSKAPSATSDRPSSLTLSRRYEYDTDAGNFNSSLSRIPGLGRAARKQLAMVLDEFWGCIFDYHGKITEEADSKRVDILIGLDLRSASSAIRTDNPSIEASKSPMMRDATQGSARALSSWDSRDKHISNSDLGLGLQMGATGSPTLYGGINVGNRDIPCSGSTSFEQNAGLCSNFNVPSQSCNQFYQPATVHGYQLATYLKGINASRSPYSSIPLDPRQLSGSSESSVPIYTDSAMHACKQNVLGSLRAGSSQSPAMNHIHTMVVERSYDGSNPVGGNESVGSSSYSKKYHSSPDISTVIAASRSTLLNEGGLGGSAVNSEEYADSAARSSSKLALNDLAQHNNQRDILYMQPRMNTNTKSFWSQQPFEPLFGTQSPELNKIEVNTGQRPSNVTKDDFSYAESEAELLQCFRFCIMKLLALEGSGWLFMQSGGCDENLIDLVCQAEKVAQEEPSDYRDTDCSCRLLNCGDDCVWQASLVVSFGVWCIHRLLDLSLVESRPELWGKYTYILNRLQGILDPAFSKPRKPLAGCACLVNASPVAKSIPGTFTTSAVILELIKDVEQAVSGRKGRSGTAAGDVAFSKGKENLASVLKRYKRRLSSKPSAGQ